jgi:helicase required for RNAi-mediated heterochromatin assembly 1
LAEQIFGLERKVPITKQLDDNPFMNISSAFSRTDRATKTNVNVVDQWPTVYTSELDESQVQALRRLLTKQLAILQGPPGTGKTRTSVAGLRILLENMAHNDPPIIIASQTNHALDQLLRHVSIFESEFIRLGSRISDKEVVKPRSLFVVRQNQRIKLDGGMKQEGRAQLVKAMNFLKLLLRPFNEITEPISAIIFRELDLLTDDQYRSLSEEDDQWIRLSAEAQTPMAAWLRGSILPMVYKHTDNENSFVAEESDPEFEQLREQEAENGGGFQRDDEEDSETLRGPYLGLFEPFRARPSKGVTSKSIEKAFKKANLWTIPEHLRPAMYGRLVEQMKAKVLARFRAEAEAYAKAVDMIKIGRWEENEVFLRKARIIGATTTGLSKYRGLITSLKPKIMIIEEAAETMEALVVASCVPSINHLILVGDHKQLQSQAIMPEFRKKPFNMSISLFERLVMNGVEYSVLTQQRRMRPEISRLLVPIYGAELQDHSNVHGRAHIRGMAQDCAFFDHGFPESADESLSKLNYREAEMIVGHYEYLFYNGIRADQITVLTFYNGQRKLLLRMLRARASLNGNIFKVATVDSFQGEEDLVVLLSLVRSNSKESIGFLAVPNRITVALSRAQYGFYIYGNITNLVSTNSMWWDIIASIPEDQVDDQPKPYLEVICQKHNAEVLVRGKAELNDHEVLILTLLRA